MVTVRKILISASVLLVGIGGANAQLPSNLAPPPIARDPGLPNSVLVGNPFLDGTRNNLGWFATVDVNAEVAHVHNELTAPVTAGITTNTVSLPSSPLNWTVSPRFEVGYRFGDGCGELLVSYRFLTTSGSQTTPDFGTLGNTGLLRSQFSMNVIDVDYACQEVALQPWADMKWRIGVRTANLLLASQEASPLLQQSENNYILGAGPHVALDLWIPAAARFGLFLKVDGAGVFGRVQQDFAETLPGGISGSTHQDALSPTAMLNVQAGVAWTPLDNWRISAGYTYEHWWDATFVNNSRGDAWTQGIFFRTEWQW
jgi:Legionella pneumophila major outer membrane protein precursor